MKTFKLITLQLAEDGDFLELPIKDGLIINKEDEHHTWLAEAFLDGEHYDYFRDLQENPEDLDVQVVITHPANDPAFFSMHIQCIKKMDGDISVLLEGHLKKPRSEYAELLLGDLMERGYSGDELLHEFKEKMISKPKIPKKVKQ
ncbi:YwpF-like family protein [Falsibacillus albus]|uniref:YwpF-like protein n=1 Tax=Falsibacillus albus TaxID=2478915 RepID=A0A3L7JV83_9BACI|nr:YwpF-like family protein [Falsibacillus albus]RLQ94767.1 hypothetical protein D9X91_12290 [Falsibacillus albus]